MNKKTKIILITSFSILFIGIALAIYFFLVTPQKKYPKEIIKQSSLYTTSQNINFKNKNLKTTEYPLFGISNTVILENIEKFALHLDPKMKKTSDTEGKLYKWENNDNYVIYELQQNTIIFNISDGITWEEADISNYTFKSFVKQYFEKNWEYKISSQNKTSEGYIIYYANRLFENNPIYTNEYNGETDYLAFKNGKIIYGKILATEFFNTKIILPLMDSKNLQKYINLDNYPKEIYPNFSTVSNSILKEVNYLSDDFEKVTKSINNCTENSVEVVYYYKNFNQETLTPVYKMDLQCDILFKNTKYTIPAVGFVSAVDPKYISTPE